MTGQAARPHRLEDTEPGTATSREGEVGDFYAQLEYPGPDSIVTHVWANRIRPYLSSEAFSFLDAGCGAGRHSAGVLLTYPKARGIGMDISRPSLDAAHALMQAKEINDRIELIQGSFAEPISYKEHFDVALAIGTIHHSVNPAQSFQNIAATIKPGGIFACMVYGERGHRRRYEIKEMLEILAGDDARLRKRLYLAYRRRYEGIMDHTLREIIAGARKRLSRWRHMFMGRRGDFGYLTSATESDVFFMDAYASPIDVAFSTGELDELLGTCGLAIEHMFTLGREDAGLLPPEWRELWSQLDYRDRVRVTELADPMPASLSFVARKGQTGSKN